MRPTPGRDFQAFERRGGFDGTWSSTEVHSHLEELRATIERPGQAALTRAVTSAAWSKGVRLTQWRESVMRYAVFLYLKERKQADPAWAPRDVFTPKEVTSAITDDLDRMAFIARETIGDYQAVSHYGDKLRRSIAGIPFWAWTETLFRRYGHFTRNVYATAGEGRYGLALGMVLKAGMVFTAIHTWNHMMRELGGCPDASPEGRLMLTVGCDDEGNVYQLRTPGMLSDFLAWWGAPEVVKAMEEVHAGRGDLRDAALDLAFAPASKLVSGVSPFLKAPAEMLLGRTVWPSLRAPREIRDPARHLANVWRLEDVYDVVRGRPSREPAGTLPWLRSMVFERRSAGEKSYHTIRALAFDWKRRVKGSDVKVIVKSEGADDLYYYRQALRLGQNDAAARYLARIEAAAERTGKSVRRVVAQANANADVLALLPKRWRAEFVAGLTRKERAHLAQARDWKEGLYEDEAGKAPGRPPVRVAPPRRVRRRCRVPRPHGGSQGGWRRGCRSTRGAAGLDLRGAVGNSPAGGTGPG